MRGGRRASESRGLDLRAYLSWADPAGEVTFTWHALPRATHHHAYELDPTREERSSLVAAARRLVAARRRAPPRGPRHRMTIVPVAACDHDLGGSLREPRS